MGGGITGMFAHIYIFGDRGGWMDGRKQSVSAETDRGLLDDKGRWVKRDS